MLPSCKDQFQNLSPLVRDLKLKEVKNVFARASKLTDITYSKYTHGTNRHGTNMAYSIDMAYSSIDMAYSSIDMAYSSIDMAYSSIDMAYSSIDIESRGLVFRACRPFIRKKQSCFPPTKATLETRQFFLATCNANLGEKDIPGSCRIVDICKLLYDLQSDYFAN